MDPNSGRIYESPEYAPADVAARLVRVPDHLQGEAQEAYESGRRVNFKGGSALSKWGNEQHVAYMQRKRKEKRKQQAKSRAKNR